MKHKEYIEKEIQYIKWFSKFHKIPIEEACNRWVEQGLAELYAKKYRKDDTKFDSHNN